MSILTAHSLTRTKMHTSHNNIAHSNLWLTSYTLTDFLMLLYLIPSHATTVSRNLSRSNLRLRSIHSCYSLILCAHDCYLTSHSFRAHIPSHDSVSPFLTQLSVPIVISHAIFARSLTRSSYLALLIPCAISIALSLSLSQGVAEPGGLQGDTTLSLIGPDKVRLIRPPSAAGAHPMSIKVKGCGAPLRGARKRCEARNRTFSYFDTTYVKVHGPRILYLVSLGA